MIWEDSRQIMLTRICTICNQTSYSSIAEGKWICPYCGADLTGEEAESSETNEK